MCGINFTTRPKMIEQMNEAISHRGLPGRVGSYMQTKAYPFAIGHVRLPIVGLDPENDQPWVFKDRVMSFSGEIYNYKKLLPIAKCDTYVLGRLYGDIRAACLNSMDGMWGFIYHDKREPRYVDVVTDFLAKKPLYIHLPTLSVSSEIKGLLVLEGIRHLDPFYFSCVGKWGYHIGDRTPFRNIRKLPPASVTRIDLEEMTFTSIPWCTLRPKHTHLRTAIEDAVENRMVSDVPISILLSGGLDSSMIYKMIERRTHDFTVYHIENAEERYLDMLNIPGDIRVEKLISEPADLDKALFFNEGPVDLGSLLPQYTASKTIRDRSPDCRVLLTGDGADELFGGYRRMAEYDAQYSDIFEELVYYHLPRLDKMSMAFTLELRSPFLARPVIEGALSLPYPDRIAKKALKRVAIGLVPQEIIDRKKWPLKSQEVLHEEGWRFHLINRFKEIADEYQ